MGPDSFIASLFLPVRASVGRIVYVDGSSQEKCIIVVNNRF